MRTRFLPDLASGRRIGAFALTEPGAGTDAGAVATTAVPDGEGYRVNGVKRFITNAGLAEVFVVVVSTDPEAGARGISLLIVERDAPGLKIGPKMRKLGIRGSDTREVVFEDCWVPQGNLLGLPGRGLGLALKALDGGRIGIAAQAVGIAQAAYEASVGYAQGRRQFGQPIADFQAIQFMLADMAVQIEAARLLTYRAAYLRDIGAKYSKEAAAAKLFASEMANRVALKAVQIYGGNGYLRDFPVERYFRDAKITEIYEGTSEAQRIVISRSLLRGE